MSSLEESYISSLIPGQNLDSGFDSLFNPQSGSFGEGYPSGLDSYEGNDEYGQAYLSLEEPHSLQPPSLQLLTMDFDSHSDHDNENSQTNELSKEHSSSGTCTVLINKSSGTDTTLDSDHANYGNLGGYQQKGESQRHLIGNGYGSASDTIDISNQSNACENLPDASDSEADEEVGPPSPVLSNVQAQPVKYYVHIIIRSSINESHPEVISERVLVESAHSNSPTSRSDATMS